MFLLFSSWGAVRREPWCQLDKLFGQWCASGGPAMGMSSKRLKIKQMIRKKSIGLLIQICCAFHFGFLGYTKKNAIGFPRKAEGKGSKGGLGESALVLQGHTGGWAGGDIKGLVLLQG